MDALMNEAPSAPARRTLAICGGRYTFVATADQTGGAYSLIECHLPARDPGPPLHIHTREDEAFYVLAGEVTLTLAGRDHCVAAGGYIFAPRNVPHRFRNDGAIPARMLVVATPGGIERFFEEIGAPWTDPDHLPPPPTAADVERILSRAPHHGIEILPAR